MPEKNHAQSVSLSPDPFDLSRFEAIPVLVVRDNVFPATSPRQDAINRVLILDSPLTEHGRAWWSQSQMSISSDCPLFAKSCAGAHGSNAFDIDGLLRDKTLLRRRVRQVIEIKDDMVPPLAKGHHAEPIEIRAVLTGFKIIDHLLAVERGRDPAQPVVFRGCVNQRPLMGVAVGFDDRAFIDNRMVARRRTGTRRENSGRSGWVPRRRRPRSWLGDYRWPSRC